MREIKFRGQIKENGCNYFSEDWIYGSLSQVNPKSISGSYFICESQTRWKGQDNDKMIGTFIKVIPETVGQYTGLKDKNRKEIYEGDIVEQTFYGDDISKQIFIIKDMILDYSKIFCGSSKENEIIGNIYENPELLK
jgi:uncharacterized phage protein (TIGR01671 family)